MKKLRVISAVALIVLFVFCSCQTFTSIIPIRVLKSDYTDEMAELALKSTVKRASESANTRFYQRINTYDFIPEPYSMMIENQEKIPGMRKLISNWNTDVEEHLREKESIIESAIAQCIDAMILENPKALVEESDTSMTTLMDGLYAKDFKALLEEVFSDMEMKTLNSMVNHYNAWVLSENFKNKTKLEEIDLIDCKPYLVESIYNYYKNDLLIFEELYRTIPDPFTEDVCKKVFGIE